MHDNERALLDAFIKRAQENVKSPMDRDVLAGTIMRKYTALTEEYAAKGHDAVRSAELAYRELGAPQDYLSAIAHKKTSPKTFCTIALCLEAIAIVLCALPMHQLMQYSGVSELIFGQSSEAVGNVGYSVGASIGYALDAGLIALVVAMLFLFQGLRVQPIAHKKAIGFAFIAVACLFLACVWLHFKVGFLAAAGILMGGLIILSLSCLLNGLLFLFVVPKQDDAL